MLHAIVFTVANGDAAIVDMLISVIEQTNLLNRLMRNVIVILEKETYNWFMP